MAGVTPRAWRLLSGQGLVGHTVVYGLGRAGAVLAQVLIVAVLSRLGGHVYLDYSLVLAAAVTATNLCVGWYRQAVLRNAGGTSDGHERAGLTSAVWWSVSLGGLLTAGAAVLLIGNGWATFGVGAVFGLTYGVQLAVLAQVQGRLDPWTSIRIEIVRLLLTGGLPLLLAGWLGVVSVTQVLLLAALANVCALAGTYTGTSRSPIGGSRLDLGYGMPMAVWLTMASALQFSDRWILEHRVGVEAAGAYAATYDLVSRGTGTLLLPILTAVHPLVMAAYNAGNSDRAMEMLRRAMTLCVGIGVVLVIFSLAFAVWGDLVAPTADTSWSVVLLLAASGVAWQVALLVHKDFEMRRSTGPLLAGITAALSFNLVANWMLAAGLGNVGVAAMNLLSTAVYVGVIALFRRIRPHAASACAEEQPSVR